MFTIHSFLSQLFYTLIKLAQIFYALGPKDVKGQRCGPNMKEGMSEPELCWSRGGGGGVTHSVAGTAGTGDTGWAGPASGL